MKCYILKYGAYGSTYNEAVFLWKKDAIAAAKKDGYKYNSRENLYDHPSNESDYRIIEPIEFYKG